MPRLEFFGKGPQLFFEVLRICALRLPQGVNADRLGARQTIFDILANSVSVKRRPPSTEAQPTAGVGVPCRNMTSSAEPIPFFGRRPQA
jgi:hypothetical protein